MSEAAMTSREHDPRTIDVLMITFNRPAYTRLSLTRLLETCDSHMRVWLWHNGSDEETLDVVRSNLDHPRVHQFHHSPENRMLREPTNWLFQESDAAYVSKVDDDCLVAEGWASLLRQAHQAEPRLGIIGCWRFTESDFDQDLAGWKIRQFKGGHSILQNCWIEGSGYLMKRTCLEACGLLRRRESFTDYCVRVARAGWVNGWYYPFIRQEHMDDPQSPHTLLRTDQDLERIGPLSAKTFGVTSLAAWDAALREDARQVQQANLDPKYWSARRNPLRRRIRRLVLSATETIPTLGVRGS